MPVIRSRGGKLESLEVSSDPLIFVIAFSTNNTNLTEKRQTSYIIFDKKKITKIRQIKILSCWTFQNKIGFYFRRYNAKTSSKGRLIKSRLDIDWWQER